VTIWANTVRALTVGHVSLGPIQIMPPPGQTMGMLVVKSTLWIIGILAVFIPTAVRQYRKAA
jgi:hypothetical protein